MFKRVELSSPADRYLMPLDPEVVKRNVNNLGKFQDLHNQLMFIDGKMSSDQDKLLSLNDRSKLLSRMFSSHQLHICYYDDIVDGVVMVKDAITGKLVKKQDTVLTVDGKFIELNKENTLSLSNPDITMMLLCVINHTFREHMSKSFLAQAEHTLKDKYYMLPSGLYMKFDADLFYVGFTFEDLGQMFNVFTRYFIHPNYGFDRDDVFYDGSEFTEDVFNKMYLHIFKDYLSSCLGSDDMVKSFFTLVILPPEAAGEKGTVIKSNMRLIPTSASHFGDMVVIYKDGSSAEVTDRTSDRTIYNIPFVEINLTNSQGTYYNGQFSEDYWRSHRSLQVDLGVATKCPIRFAIKINKKFPNSKSVPTENNAGRIMNYNARVPDYKASFLMTKDEEEYYKVNKTAKPTMLGIELEYIIKRSASQRTDRVKLCSKTMKDIADSGFGNHCLLKFDRSIGEGETNNPTGFEVVTIPATLDYHKKMFDDNFFQHDPNQKKWKCRHPVMATSTCGLHVHISKDSFLPSDKNERDRSRKYATTFKLRLGKFIAFMSSPDNLQFISDLAGRPPNMYCVPNPIKEKNRFGVHNGIGSARNITPTKGTPHINHDSRRVIVNTENSETIEVRIFDSTTERNQLFRRLEFCHALVEFVKVASPKQLTIYHFVKWLCEEKGSKKRYEALLHWLSTRKLVSVTKKANVKSKKIIKTYGPCLIAAPKEPDKTTEGYTWPRPQQEPPQPVYYNTGFASSPPNFGNGGAGGLSGLSAAQALGLAQPRQRTNRRPGQ